MPRISLYAIKQLDIFRHISYFSAKIRRIRETTAWINEIKAVYRKHCSKTYNAGKDTFRPIQD